MSTVKVLSIQLPAPCPMNCGFCRTPEHGDGDPDSILSFVMNNVDKYVELYITSNGETGLSPIFEKIVEFTKTKQVQIAVLCATERSVIQGLSRVEVSLNEHTERAAIKAIKKAKRLKIPVVISMVDTGRPVDLEKIAKQYGVDGVIVRAIQAEGRSHELMGSTRWFKRIGATLGQFPVAAYKELVGLGASKTTCVNHDGRIVPILGGV